MEQELAELEGPGGLRAGFSAVTFKLRWQDETRKKLPGLHTDYGALPLPLGGRGRGAGQARHGRTERDTGQGMWERCDLRVSSPGVSIAHYPCDFGGHLTSAFHFFTAMHRGNRCVRLKRGLGHLSGFTLAKTPHSSWHIRRLSFLPAPFSPAAPTWAEGPDPPLLPIPAQLVIGSSPPALFNSNRLLSGTCFGQTWEWDSRPDQNRWLPSGSSPSRVRDRPRCLLMWHLASYLPPAAPYLPVSLLYFSSTEIHIYSFMILPLPPHTHTAAPNSPELPGAWSHVLMWLSRHRCLGTQARVWM